MVTPAQGARPPPSNAPAAPRRLFPSLAAVMVTRHLIEFCCGEDSIMGQIGAKVGCTVTRITEKIDAMSSRGA